MNKMKVRKNTLGKFTAILGKRLRKRLEGCEVYYDHGDSSSRIPVYFGDYSRKNILSFVDIVVLKDGDVKIVCEIEETASTPKKVLGDLVSILLGEKIRCGGTDYLLSSPAIVIGLQAKEKGVKDNQISGMLDRLSRVFNLDLEMTTLVFSEKPEELINNVEKSVMEFLEK